MTSGPHALSGPSPGASSSGSRGGRPEPIGDVLRRLSGDFRPAARRRRSEVAAAWDAVCVRAGVPGLADETVPAALQKGVLIVEVRSTALLAELNGFRQAAMLALLLDAAPGGKITGLRFRPGVF